MSQGKRILIVDDDEDFCITLSRTLARKGFEVQTANNPSQALDRAGNFKPATVILDLRLGRDSGLRLIEPLLGLDPSLAIFVLTAYGSIATAVEAIKMGDRPSRYLDPNSNFSQFTDEQRRRVAAQVRGDSPRPTADLYLIEPPVLRRSRPRS